MEQLRRFLKWKPKDSPISKRWVLVPVLIVGALTISLSPIVCGLAVGLAAFIGYAVIGGLNEWLGARQQSI
jgi:hypothetical protein